MIEFVPHHGGALSDSEKEFIMNVFEQLISPDSYYTTLQLIYNNSTHFTTVPFDICTFQQIKLLVKNAFSRTRKLTINGTIHHNHHRSGILYDYHTKHGLFVEDTYIRVTDNMGVKYHILLNPPKIHSAKLYEFYAAQQCDIPHYFIPPSF